MDTKFFPLQFEYGDGYGWDTGKNYDESLIIYDTIMKFLRVLQDTDEKYMFAMYSHVYFEWNVIKIASGCAKFWMKDFLSGIRPFLSTILINTSKEVVLVRGHRCKKYICNNENA